MRAVDYGITWKSLNPLHIFIYLKKGKIISVSNIVILVHNEKEMLNKQSSEGKLGKGRWIKMTFRKTMGLFFAKRSRIGWGSQAHPNLCALSIILKTSNDCIENREYIEKTIS
jgi:hypothetical protein